MKRVWWTDAQLASTPRRTWHPWTGTVQPSSDLETVGNIVCCNSNMHRKHWNSLQVLDASVWWVSRHFWLNAGSSLHSWSQDNKVVSARWALWMSLSRSTKHEANSATSCASLYSYFRDLNMYTCTWPVRSLDTYFWWLFFHVLQWTTGLFSFHWLSVLRRI